MDTELAIVTDRLLLRPAAPADVDTLMRLATPRPTDTLEARRARIARLVANSATWFEAHGYGLWLVVDRASDEPIGYFGARPEDEGATHPELLYGMVDGRRAQGFGSEAGRAVIERLFERSDVKDVWAATTPDNVSSIRLMERLDMAFEARRTLDGVDSVIHRRRRSAGQLPR